jgi:hypothetical protein
VPEQLIGQRCTNPEEVAWRIDPALKDKILARKRGATSGQGAVHVRPGIVGQVASWIGSDASQFLRELERSYPEVAHVPDGKLLKAINRAGKRGELTAAEVRKELDSFFTPRITIISAPMGGQPQERPRQSRNFSTRL